MTSASLRTSIKLSETPKISSGTTSFVFESNTSKVDLILEQYQKTHDFESSHVALCKILRDTQNLPTEPLDSATADKAKKHQDLQKFLNQNALVFEIRQKYSDYSMMQSMDEGRISTVPQTMKVTAGYRRGIGSSATQSFHGIMLLKDESNINSSNAYKDKRASKLRACAPASLTTHGSQNKAKNGASIQLGATDFASQAKEKAGNALQNPTVKINEIPNVNAELQKTQEFEIAINKIAEKMRYYYSEHRVDEAHQFLLQYQYEMDSKRKSPGPQMARILENKDFENHSLIKDIESQFSELQNFMNMIDAEDAWILERTKGGLQIKYKVNGNESITLKMEGTMDCPLFNLITVINEPDNYVTWVPFCKEGMLLNKINKAHKVAYIRISMPGPLADREAFLEGYGVFRPNGTIVILSKSIDENQAFLERYNIKLPNSNKNVRITMKYFGFEITPITRNKLKVRAVCNADPKISFLPMSVLNWFVRKLAMGVLEKMITTAKTLKGSVFEKVMKDPAKVEFYNWLETALNDFLREETDNRSNKLSETGSVVSPGSKTIKL